MRSEAKAISNCPPLTAIPGTEVITEDRQLVDWSTVLNTCDEIYFRLEAYSVTINTSVPTKIALAFCSIKLSVALSA